MAAAVLRRRQRRVLDEGPAYGLTTAGPDGAVWVVQPGDESGRGWGLPVREPGDAITLVGPEGPRMSVRLPAGVRTVASVHADGDETLYVTIRPDRDVDHPSGFTELLRWDGRWTPVPYPGEDLLDVAADAGGNLWALVTPVGAPDADSVVARRERVGWTLFPEVAGLSSLTLGPGGSVCGMSEAGLVLVCVEPAGRVLRQPIGVSGGLSIGEDGSVWLAHEGMLARLPITAPR